MDHATATARAASATGLFTRRLTDECLVKIATHKYKGGSYTPVDNFLNPFWLWCANLLPMWMAPNLVTLIGLGFNFLAFYLITTETDGNFEGEIRPWINAACGFCLFAYQTLDAMDGKHARATKNSTPLGQLFDHGCDALSCPMMVLSLMSCLQLGVNSIVIYGLLSAQVPFFLAQWAESKTGSMQHSLMGLFGVTETQLMFCLIHLISAYLPCSFWTETVGSLDMFGYPDILLQPNYILVFGILIPGALVMSLNQLITTPADASDYVSLPKILITISASNSLIIFILFLFRRHKY
jgi:ethanolaminephosphotransferase